MINMYYIHKFLYFFLHILYIHILYFVAGLKFTVINIFIICQLTGYELANLQLLFSLQNINCHNIRSKIVGNLGKIICSQIYMYNVKCLRFTLSCNIVNKN